MSSAKRPGKTPAPGDSFKLSPAGHAVQIAMADAGDGVFRFSGVAYTGGMVSICAWWNPVIVDLSGVKPPVKARPVLFEHDTEKPVGHFEPGDYVNDGKQIAIAGALSVDNEWQRQIVSSSKNGFPWQMSIGAQALRVEEVQANAEVKVNGQVFQGPCSVVREAVLKEISYVALGADDDTAASIAASRRRGAALSHGGKIAMKTFDEWVRDKGLDPEALTEDEKSALQREYDDWKSEQAGDGDGGSDAEAGARKPNIRAAAPMPDIAARNMELGIMASDVKFAGLSADLRLSLLAEAKKSGWTTDHLAARLDNEVVKANRPKHPGAPCSGYAVEAAHLRANLMLRFGVKPETVEKAVGAPALEAGRTRFSGLSLKGLIAICCALDGRPVPAAYASGDDFLRAAFSTASFPRILSDSMNKALVQAYELAPMVSRRLARKLSVNDFKTNTGIAFTRGKPWEEVAPDGQIKHGDIGKEEAFTYSIKTLGEIIGFTRQMIRNDDLGVFDDFLSRIAANGLATEEKNFFDMFHRNAGNFISAAKGNLVTTQLNVDGIQAAITAFRKRKNVSGQFINVEPKILLVPPELEFIARQLVESSTIFPGGTNAKAAQLDKNMFAGKFEVIVAPALSDPIYATSSVTEADLGKCWYLMADPQQAAAWGRVYLDGQETPIVEQDDQDFTRLGTQLRGYIDLGHCQIDPKMVVKSDGSA